MEIEEIKNKVINSDCLSVLKELPDNSIDTIITDPPYGLSFMGKKWDYDIPSIEIWKECLRVLKYGGTALIFGGSRTYHRMACAVEDAGFLIKDCIMWIYGSGFPKATDISKQLDNGNRKKIKVKPRPITSGTMANGSDTRPWIEKSRENGYHEIDDNNPISEQAKKWNGWKSHGLKPAYEPIIVAIKQNEGSYSQNALKWGVSGLNIDECRIEHNEPEKYTNRKPLSETGSSFNSKTCGFRPDKVKLASPSNKGRFPSNVILDEEAGKLLDEQSGEIKGDSRTSKSTYDKGAWGNMKPVESNSLYNDKGGASRFFYCAKASKSERNEGCYRLEDKIQNRMRPDKNEATGLNKEPRWCHKISKNNHPTVKPLKLMEYLCKLTKTPEGGIVLDLFAGSGTTLLAALNVGRDFIGIEKEKEYCEIAEARIKKVSNKLF